MKAHDYRPIGTLPSPQSAPANRASGLVSAVMSRWNAWVTEQQADADIRVMECDARLQRASVNMAAAQLESRERLARLSRASLVAEHECYLAQVLAYAPLEAVRVVLEREIAVEKLLMQRDAVRAARLSINSTQLAPPTSAPALPAPTTIPGRLEPMIADREIETVAHRAAARASQLDQGTRSQFLSTWRQKLSDLYPTAVAQEIDGRARELLDLLVE